MVPNKALIQRFLFWIQEGVENKAAAFDEFTPNVWSTALKAVQKAVDDALTKANLPKSGRGYVRSLPGIDIADKAMVVKHQQKENTGDVDIQENLNSVISRDQLLCGIRFLLTLTLLQPSFLYLRPVLHLMFQAGV